MRKYIDNEAIQAIKDVCADYIKESLGTDNDIHFSVCVYNLCVDYLNLKCEYIKMESEYDTMYHDILKAMGVDTDD